MQRVVEFDVVLMQQDMAGKGWEPADLAYRTKKAKSTVSRFFSGKSQTAKTAKVIARALGQPVERYIRPVSGTPAVRRRAQHAPEVTAR